MNGPNKLSVTYYTRFESLPSCKCNGFLAHSYVKECFEYRLLFLSRLGQFDQTFKITDSIHTSSALKVMNGPNKVEYFITLGSKVYIVSNAMVFWPIHKLGRK
jgi:hypothetical protein